MFGGDGAVNFSLLAAYAESYAPADANREAIVFAVGRGVGRAAVHEFGHQLLGSAQFDGTDAQSYEDRLGGAAGNNTTGRCTGAVRGLRCRSDSVVGSNRELSAARRHTVPLPDSSPCIRRD